jgi:hypothetical protein
MILRRTLEGAPKCAFLLLRREDAIPVFSSEQIQLTKSSREAHPMGDASSFWLLVENPSISLCSFNCGCRK